MQLSLISSFIALRYSPNFRAKVQKTLQYSRKTALDHSAGASNAKNPAEITRITKRDVVKLCENRPRKGIARAVASASTEQIAVSGASQNSAKISRMRREVASSSGWFMRQFESKESSEGLRSEARGNGEQD
jgi:hypothetical protein